MSATRALLTLVAGAFALLTPSRPARAIEPSRVFRALPATPWERSLDADDADEGSGPRRETEFFRNLVGGDLDAARLQRMIDDARSIAPERATSGQPVNNWTLAGPAFSTNTGGGFITGRVRDIDAIHVRVLAASGGLWKFNIFGGIPMCDSVPASWFGSFATSPLNSDVILLGTGEFGQGAGTGLYKTTDGGTSWTKMAMSPQPIWFTKVRWSPDGSVAIASSNAGIHRSTDGGVTWTRVHTLETDDVTFVIGRPTEMFAACTNQGLWRSTDSGASWTKLTAGNAPPDQAGLGAVSAVFQPLISPNPWVYAAFNNRIWFSNSDGATWSEVTPTNFGIGNSGYGPCISANPLDPQTVLYGDVPFVRSDNAGATWTKLASSHLHADYHAFAWDTDNTGVWAANDGGWSHSTDRGLTWSSSSNVMPVSQFYSLECERTEEGYMIGGTQDNNILYTPNPSLNWIDPSIGSTEGDAYGATIDMYNPTHLWSVTGLFNGNYPWQRSRSYDGGTTWTEVDNGIDFNSSPGVIRNDNAFPVRLVTAAGTFVYESLDGGDTWTKSNPAGFPVSIRSLECGTRVANGAVLYAALNSTQPGQRLFVRDNGVWSERSAGLPSSASVLRVVPHPWAGAADEAWAIVGAGGKQLWHTTNRGLDWTNVTGDLPSSMSVTSLVVNPWVTGQIFIGTLLGVYRSDDGGAHWEHWNNGMPQYAMISELHYIDNTPSGGHFFVVAATYGRSVFRRDVGGDDAFPVITLSSPAVQENHSGQSVATFRAALSSASSQSVTANWATQDSTATVADNDYVASSGSLFFAPGQTVTYFSVPINGDTQIEPDETFKVVLSNPLRAMLGNPATGTIEDDDAQGLVSHDQFVTDGTVNAVVNAGGTVYVGGSFAHVATGIGGAVPLDASTGLPRALPRVDGSVYSLVDDGGGGWYIGGAFAHVGGVPRTNLAHVLADGSVDSWNPGANDLVFALAKRGGTIYAGGRFTTVYGVPHAYLAAIPTTGSMPAEWYPNPGDAVLTLALSDTTLYVGGTFTSMGGLGRSHIAAVGTNSGRPTAWAPFADADVSALLLDGGLLYAAGSFTTIGGQARHFLAALSRTTPTATAWAPEPDNLVFCLGADAGAIYAGGVFATIGGQTRTNLAALDRSSGSATAWAPNPDGGINVIATAPGLVYAGGAFANIGGQPRADLAAIDATTGLATGWNPAPDNTVLVLSANGGTVFAGGVFRTLAATPRANLAAFDATTGVLLPWNPGADGAVFALAEAGGVVYAGGSFLNVNGQPRNRIAAVDSASGAPTSWDPNASGTVRTLLLTGTRLCVGGAFTTIVGQPRNRVAALTLGATAGVTSWNPNANGTVLCLASDGTTVFAGGAFTSIGDAPRSAIAALNGTTGAALAGFAPNANGTVNALTVNSNVLYVGGAFTQIAGVTRPRLVAFNVATGAIAAWAPAPNGTVSSITTSTLAQVYVGGTFTTIGGVARSCLALLRPSTNSVSSWAPEPDGAVNAIAQAGGALYVGGAFNRLANMPQAHFGRVILQTVVGVPGQAPGGEFAMNVSPNPSPGRVRIDYSLPEAARVSIAVYDVAGRRVGAAIDERQAAGAHSVAWDGAGVRGVTAGVYFVRLAAGEAKATRRIVLF